MSKEKLPCITEDILRRFTDARSFQRGMEYYHDEAIRDPLREGFLLQGLCEGSRREPYKVRVLLEENGVEEASCSCPRGGFCKHIVALLMTYIHEPDAFCEMDSLQKRLAGFTKEDLINLICDIVQQDMSLMGMVERRVSLSDKSQVDRALLCRDVQRILNMSCPEDIAGNLWDLLQIAEKKEDWLEAGAIFKEILEGLTSVYEEELLEMDDDEEINGIARACVEGLGKCLGRCDDDAVRQDWLSTLMEAELADIAMGGVEFSGDAFDVIFTHCTRDDWPLLEKRVMGVIPESRGWSREQLVEILIWGMEMTGRDAGIAQVIERFGTKYQIMFLRVQEGKPREAVTLARKYFLKSPGIIIQMTKYLVEAGAADYGVALVTQLAQSMDSSPGYLEWLADYYCRENNLEEALKWQKELFIASPRVDHYKLLQEIGDKLNVWENLRVEALKILEEKGQWTTFLEIALHEENMDRALELLPRVQGGWRDYNIAVAEAAEDKRPYDAITLYEKIVEERISERHRQTYQQAATYLQRIKIIYEGLGEREKWKSYITGVRNKYARFPAFQDELNKAGL